MNFELLHPREQIVQIINRIYHGEMTTLSGGNLSIKDYVGNIWITPAGIDKGKLQPSDIICIQPNGDIVGPHKPSSEYPFHGQIYERRPDLKAVVHAHPPVLVAFSITHQIPDTCVIPQARRVCGEVGFAAYALPGSEQLGNVISDAFAKNYNAVLLENHGIITAGSDLLSAFQRLETLEFCARTISQAKRIGSITVLNEDQISFFDHRQASLPEFDLDLHSSCERELRKQIVDIASRSCDRSLMISTEGVISACVKDTEFLITPTGMDRRSFEIEDIVYVKNGKRERGKIPSRSVLLHQQIYCDHPDINTIITSQAPNITAFAISDQKMDTKTVPESYILLLDIPRVPFGLQFKEPEKISDMISVKRPVLLLQNDCVLVTGKNMLEAFDRLEVADFIARSLIDSRAIGQVKKIWIDDVTEIEKKFLNNY